MSHFWRRHTGHPPKDHIRIARLSSGELVRYDLMISDKRRIDEYMRITTIEWEYIGEGVIHSIDGSKYIDKDAAETKLSATAR